MGIFDQLSQPDTNFLPDTEGTETVELTNGQIVHVLPVDGEPGGLLFASIVNTDSSNGKILLEDLRGQQFEVGVERVEAYSTKDVLRIVSRYMLFEDIMGGAADLDAEDNPQH